mmetsp:Transcript_42488/g.112553  ORF Transcript_42488/g.112553 Transcript_42488/m.112553 type:complete len:206 (+) Transcript_42488:109-726(+)
MIWRARLGSATSRARGGGRGCFGEAAADESLATSFRFFPWPPLAALLAAAPLAAASCFFPLPPLTAPPATALRLPLPPLAAARLATALRLPLPPLAAPLATAAAPLASAPLAAAPLVAAPPDSPASSLSLAAGGGGSGSGSVPPGCATRQSASVCGMPARQSRSEKSLKCFSRWIGVSVFLCGVWSLRNSLNLLAGSPICPASVA